MRHVSEGIPVTRGPGRFTGDASYIGADDDTVELELSPQQMLTLERAADEARTAANQVEAPPSSASESPPVSTSEATPIATSEPLALPALEPPRLLRSNAPQANPTRNVIVAARSRAGTWPLARVASALGMVAAVIGIGSAAHRLPERASSASASAVKEAPAPTTAGARDGAETGAGTKEAASDAAGAQEATSSTGGTAEPQGTPDLTVRFKNPFDASEVFEFPPGTSVAEARQSVAEVLLERARDRRSLTREELRRLSENLIAR